MDSQIQQVDESAESTQMSARSFSMIALRKSSLFLVFSSLILILVALIKERFLSGIIRYNSNLTVVHQGMFQTCLTENDYSGYACTRDMSLKWMSGSGPDLWRAASAMLLIELLIKIAAFCLMILRPRLKNTIGVKALKYALPVMFASCAIFGVIAISFVAATSSTDSRFKYGRVQSWSFDVSMYLMIVAYPFSVVGYILYGVGWRMEVKPVGDTLLQPSETNGSEAATGVQLHQVMPQQVAITVNGQTMMATLTPVQHHQPQYQPPALADINYVPNPSAQPVYQNYPQPNPNPMVLMNGQPMHHVYPHLPQYNQTNYTPYGHGELTTSLPA